MVLELHTKSREGLYEATAIYEDGVVTVNKGSRINLHFSDAFKPSALVKEKLEDSSLVSPEGVLLKNISFSSLSTAATFVAGRTSNGMITWKTKDEKYVRYTLKPEK